MKNFPVGHFGVAMPYLLMIGVFLSACSGKIAQTEFAAEDVELTVNFIKIERHDPHDWVFAEVQAKFLNRRSSLDMRCLQFTSGKYISNRVWVNSYVSYFPILEADQNRLASRQFYWVVDKGISPVDLKNVKFKIIKEDPDHRTIAAKCD